MGDRTVRVTLRWTARVIGFGTAAYAMYVGVTWLRYGHPAPARPEDRDLLLDRVMPAYDVAERHHIHVAAPADITLSAAADIDLQRVPAVRGIFRARELLLGSESDMSSRPTGLVALTKSLGWGVLAEVPGSEIVMGAVTKPWDANVVFRPLTPEAFAAFNEPGYVKIAWTLRTDATNAAESVFRTETRAIATDRVARSKFRRYWSFLSPGIIVIRWAMLRPLKGEAERRAHGASWHRRTLLRETTRRFGLFNSGRNSTATSAVEQTESEHVSSSSTRLVRRGLSTGIACARRWRTL